MTRAQHVLLQLLAPPRVGMPAPVRLIEELLRHRMFPLSRSAGLSAIHDLENMGLLERHPNPSVPGIRLSRLGVQFVELPFFQEPLSSPNLGRQGRPPSEFA